MKKLLLSVLVSAFCAGCDVESHETIRSHEIYFGCGEIIDVIEYEGHQYLTRVGGGIIHSASCKCKKGGEE